MQMSRFISQTERETHWKSVLLQYWAEQRHRDVWVHSWALPSLLPATPAGGDTNTAETEMAINGDLIIGAGVNARVEIEGAHSNKQWRTFDLPADLLNDLQRNYYASKRTRGSDNETLISTVFNQLEVRTGYVPLPYGSSMS
jgi:hypothetical protein